MYDDKCDCADCRLIRKLRAADATREAPMVRLCLVCLQDYVGSTDEHQATPAHQAAEARSLHPTQPIDRPESGSECRDLNCRGVHDFARGTRYGTSLLTGLPLAGHVR